ncbi:hypothetical protein DAPPUDRAFT_342551, partial [Daphnia pulex]
MSQRKENGQWRALLTIYGDQLRNQSALFEDVEEAKDLCIKYYVIFLIKENIMMGDYLPGTNFANYQDFFQESLQPGGGVYPHVVQIELDNIIKKKFWVKKEYTYPKGNEYACTLLVFLPGLKYKVTIIDCIKDYAITDAYLKIFELLYRFGKILVYRPPANNTVGVYLVEDEREEEDEDEEEVEVVLSKAVDQGQGLCGPIAPDPVGQT